MSLRAAEVKTGVPFTTIDRVEKGKTVPSLDVLYRLAEGYGVPIAEIVSVALPTSAPPASEPGKRGGAKGKGKTG